MRYAFILLGALFTFALTSPASAYCCWNEAICVAVCGSKCCGQNFTRATPTDPSGLGQFQIQDLMSTYNQAETSETRASRAFLRVLAAEIRRRGGTVPTRPQ